MSSSGAPTRPVLFVPLDQLALSPQCGFSSAVLGNKLTVEAQIAKLKLVVKIGREVWPL